MRRSLFILAAKDVCVASLALCLAGSVVRAQEIPAPQADSNQDWMRYDWLKPAEDQQRQTATGQTFHATAGRDIADPFTVLTTGALYQEKYGASYTRQLDDSLSLSYETSGVTLNDGSNPYVPLANGPAALADGQKAGLQFQPIPDLAIKGDVHNSTSDPSMPEDATSTHGAGLTAEGHLPLKSIVTLGLSSDHTTSGDLMSGETETHHTVYDAQVEQPIGKIPLSAVLKGHYEETTLPGAVTAALPVTEQALVWKPAQDTTVKLGLRQQRYQNFPGITSDYNQAVFADWSQKVSGDMTWHSYAEMLDAHSNLELAPGVSTSGANGVPQSSTPGGPSVSSAVPLIADDKTLTFTTGPSFKLEKDISASIEYSDRWDPSPIAGAVGQEQRVSFSLKGSF